MAAVTSNRQLLQARLHQVVVDVAAALEQRTTTSGGGGGGGGGARARAFVPRRELLAFAEATASTHMAPFSDAGGPWFVAPGGPNEDLVKHASIDLGGAQTKALEANTALLAAQVRG